MAQNKQSISGLSAIKRDFSSNMVKKEPELDNPRSLAAQKKSLVSASMRALIAQGVAERSADAGSSSLSQKRQVIADKEEQNTKKRRLPESWDQPGASPRTYEQHQRAMSTSSQTLNRTASSSSLPASSSAARPARNGEPLVIPAATSAKASGKPAAIFLSKEQRAILNLVHQGDNVFYTGSAGTGKSVLLREIIKTMQKKYVKYAEAVAITASTGIAACNIGGVTLHSFAGIGLGIESVEDLVQKIRKSRKSSSRWLRTKVLIIDELSMVDGELFDKLARIGSIVRNNPKLFGGIQVIVTGDFFQLPPVSRGKPLKFSFEAALWSQTIKHSIKLTKVFRQKDQEFVDMLNEMRYGQLSNRSIQRFKSLSRDIIYEDGIGPTELFPRREDVDNSNRLRMSKLVGESRTYFARDTGSAYEDQRRKLLDNFMAPEVLLLTIGAQVMLIKNVDETLVNGSMGIIQRFIDPSTYATEASDPDYLTGNKPGAGPAGAKKPAADKTLMPLVEFNTPGGGKRPILVLPEVWKVELPNGEVQAQRQQLPLILSWSMSIHKSQGQTLDRVKVDLSRVFEKGQAYVALSRATSLDGLQVLNFSPDKVFVHEKVRDWSKTLKAICDDGNDDDGERADGY